MMVEPLNRFIWSIRNESFDINYFHHLAGVLAA